MPHRYSLSSLVLAVLTMVTLLVTMWASPGYCVGTGPKLVQRMEAQPAKERIVIDGKLTEKIWRSAPVTNFFQQTPREGDSASHYTEAHVAYDDKYLYIGVRMFDARDSITSVLSRRDVDPAADFIYVGIDPYHDKRSGYYFIVYASGSLSDGILMNDNDADASWDGVWDGSASIDSLGWTAEFKIPFSQLHFQPNSTQVWGINFFRHIQRLRENDLLAYTPRDGSGFVSRFPDLIGLEKIQQGEGVEIIPYVTGRLENTQHDPGDPFNTGSNHEFNAGGDIKASIGPNFALNTTINPDFGQVEVDPAVVNLSDVETFYDEKRPFFIEGNRYFNFGRGGTNRTMFFDWPGPALFYSRRIGRTPQGSVPDTALYARSPLGTHILGALKFTGKVDDTWELGAIHGVTRREFADVAAANNSYQTEVEPATYYSVLRTQKQFNDAKDAIGILSTYTNRFFNDPLLPQQINHTALVNGLDGWFSLDSSRDWLVTTWFANSHVTGTKEQMLALQENSTHYFQRPVSYLHVDSSATSLDGYAGRVALNKELGNYSVNAALGVISPGFEANDLGYLARTDLINAHIFGAYRWNVPNDYYRFIYVNSAYYRSYDFGGNLRSNGIQLNSGYQAPSYYGVDEWAGYDFETVDVFRTRGGPPMLIPAHINGGFDFFSDGRKAYVYNFGAYGATGKSGMHNWGTWINFDWDVAENLHIGINPSYDFTHVEAQWVGAYADPLQTATNGTRYVFAAMDQYTLSAGIRINWTLSPTLSLQTYFQPLLSTGSFDHYKELRRPNSFEFNSYDGLVHRDEYGNLVVDPDGSGPAGLQYLDDPNFNFKSLRGNAVLRWEYSPGAAVYLVWTQSREDDADPGDFRFHRDFTNLINTKPDNIFILKFSYWLGL